MECIVHYTTFINEEYTILKVATPEQLEKVNSARKLRQALGGVNHHKTQCDLLPETLEDGTHLLHKKPCYDKFVKILYSKGLQQESEKDENPSKRYRSDRLTPAEPTVPSVKWFYGDKCVDMFESENLGNWHFQIK